MAEEKPKDPRAVAIGERIAIARAGAGYTNATIFARQLEVDRNSIGRWERGEVTPTALNLEAITRLCRVSADWILRGAAAPHASAVLAAWYATARGSSAGAQARSFLESLPLFGYVPNFTFYDMALLAFENGLSPEKAAEMAKENVTALEP